jgi:hypothetical protein
MQELSSLMMYQTRLNVNYICMLDQILMVLLRSSAKISITLKLLAIHHNSLNHHSHGVLLTSLCSHYPIVS